METEDLVLNECGKGEIVKEVGEVFPNVGVAVFAQALVVKSIHLRDLTGLVIASENSDTLRVANFKGNQKRNSFHGVVTAVDVVTLKVRKDKKSELTRSKTSHEPGKEKRKEEELTHEEVIRVWVRASNTEELH